jgi:TIR domain-containing protein
MGCELSVCETLMGFGLMIGDICPILSDTNIAWDVTIAMPELDRTGAVRVPLYWLSVKTSQDVPLGDTHMGMRGQVSLFISYSHTDRPWIEIFRKELQAALFEKATVWCDQDIAEGTPWHDRLALLYRTLLQVILQ